MKNVANPCVALIVPWPGQVRTVDILPRVYWANPENAKLSHGVVDALSLTQRSLGKFLSLNGQLGLSCCLLDLGRLLCYSSKPILHGNPLHISQWKCIYFKSHSSVSYKVTVSTYSYRKFITIHRYDSDKSYVCTEVHVKCAGKRQLAKCCWSSSELLLYRRHSFPHVVLRYCGLVPGIVSILRNNMAWQKGVKGFSTDFNFPACFFSCDLRQLSSPFMSHSIYGL